MNPKQFLSINSVKIIESSGGRELRIICPHCKNEKQKCHVNAKSGNWYCFHCGYGGSFKMLIEALSLKNQGEPINIQEDVEKWDMVTPIAEEDVEENHKRLLEMLKTDTGLQTYLYTKRGYNIETIKNFKLGWGEGRNLIIPIYDSVGNCVNFKLKHDPTVPVPSKGMFNIEGRGAKRIFNDKVLNVKTKQATERIIITEGEWDAMLLSQMGYSAVTSTGGAMSFDESWIPAFTKFNKVYLCFDNDKNEVGQKATKRTADLFLKHGIRVFIIKLPQPLPHEDKLDITDFFTKRRKTREDFTNLLKNADEYSGNELAHEKYRFIDGATLDEMEFPEKRWLVDRFIQEAGVSCIAGPGGAGKSFFTMYLASCIAQGSSMLNKFPTKMGNVLFIDKENAIEWTQDRLKKFKMPKESLKNMFFMSQGNFMVESKESVEQVEACIQAHNIKLVIIDTLIKIHEGDEVSATDIDKISKIFMRFQKLGAAVLFVHHFVKENGQFPMNNVISALRGSSHIYNMVDNYFAYYVKKGVLRVDMAKARNDELMKPFKIDCFISETEAEYNYVGEITDEEEESYRRVSCKELIKKYLTMPKKRKDIIDTINPHFSKPTIERTLAEMRKLGEVETQANGHDVIYSIPHRLLAKEMEENLASF